MIVLAAGQGTRLRPLTDDRPKCLVELGGRPLLSWTLSAAKSAGIADVVVVGGYRVETLGKYTDRVIANPHFATTNMVRTLFCAEAEFGDGFIMSYGDIAYSPRVLRQLMDDPSPISVAVDRSWRPYWQQRFEDPLADAETLDLDDRGFITDIGQKPSRIDDIKAQYIGLVAFRAEGVKQLVAAYRAAQVDQEAGRMPFEGKRSLDQLYMTDLLQGLISRGAGLKAVPIDRGWVEVDSPRDLSIAEDYVATGGLGEQA